MNKRSKTIAPKASSDATYLAAMEAINELKKSLTYLTQDHPALTDLHLVEVAITSLEKKVKYLDFHVRQKRLINEGRREVGKLPPIEEEWLPHYPDVVTKKYTELERQKNELEKKKLLEELRD